MNDYERVARAIRFLDQHQDEQPDLPALAKRAGLSQFHFHRLFSKWAGVTPKDFLQCLTLARAKDLLRAGQGVLESALRAGLSGPGRLHDLCVTLAGASPGEIKAAGASWTLAAGFASSPFGRCLVAQSLRGICHLAFVGAGGDRAAWASLAENWPEARLRRDDFAAKRIANQIFLRPVGSGAPPALKALVKGTAFQVRVWRALIEIPPGRIISYGRLAHTLGMPAAARAVGAAVARNSVAYLIPCHRVIRETGVIGDYRWGRERKRIMLAWERAQTLGL
jgi:AraC family transcriptional regulator of adaptative response/methylated-DNA-[protein]-cysteine methyltransferase